MNKLLFGAFRNPALQHILRTRRLSTFGKIGEPIDVFGLNFEVKNFTTVVPYVLPFRSDNSNYHFKFKLVCFCTHLEHIYLTQNVPDIIFREHWDVSCPVHVFCRYYYFLGNETNCHSDVHCYTVRTFLDLVYSIKFCMHSAVYNVTLSVLWVVTCFVLQYEQITDILLMHVWLTCVKFTCWLSIKRFYLRYTNVVIASSSILHVCLEAGRIWDIFSQGHSLFLHSQLRGCCKGRSFTNILFKVFDFWFVLSSCKI